MAIFVESSNDASNLEPRSLTARQHFSVKESEIWVRDYDVR